MDLDRRHLLALTAATAGLGTAATPARAAPLPRRRFLRSG
jgi:hypothetical protein